MKDYKKPTEKECRAPVRQDACILAEAWLALWKAEELHCLDTSRLDIKVRDCKLWLKGRMANTGQCRLAERITNAISGVKAVYCELVIEEEKISQV